MLRVFAQCLKFYRWTYHEGQLVRARIFQCSRIFVGVGPDETRAEGRDELVTEKRYLLARDEFRAYQLAAVLQEVQAEIEIGVLQLGQIFGAQVCVAAMQIDVGDVVHFMVAVEFAAKTKAP